VGSVSLIGYLDAMIACFLIGVNSIVLYRFWPEPWLSLKVVAVNALLTYVTLSALLGSPAQWRLAWGLCALLVDCAAAIGLWAALDDSRRGDGVLVAYRRR
jgi:uncharacterized membrane protein